MLETLSVKRTLLILIGLLSVTPVSLSPQEFKDMEPLVEHMERVGATRDAVRYIFRRCAALSSLMSTALDERTDVTQAMKDQVSANTRAFLVRAARVEALYEPDEAKANRDMIAAIEAIQTLYRDRFNHNMATTGAFFADDKMITDDYQVCVSMLLPP